MKNKINIVLFMISISILLSRPLGAENIYDSAGGYIKKEILFMKWGSGKNEVELKEEELTNTVERNNSNEIVRIVPARIKVDGNGSVYFEDIVKWEVVKYNQKSKLIEKHKSNDGFLKVLADGEQEGLYILNPRDNTVDIISGKDRIRKINRHISDYLISTDLKINNKVLYSDKKRKVSFDETDTSEIKGQEGETILEYDFNAKKALIKYKIIEPLYTHKFYNLKTIGAGCDEMKYKTGVASEYQGFINSDKNKNVYYLFSISPADQYSPIEYFIAIINYDYCEIEILLLEIDDFTGYMASPLEYVAVDKNGNIYQLLNKEDGVHVLSWSKEE